MEQPQRDCRLTEDGCLEAPSVVRRSPAGVYVLVSEDTLDLIEAIAEAKRMDRSMPIVNADAVVLLAVEQMHKRMFNRTTPI